MAASGMKISIQHEDFSLDQEAALLRAGRDTGAIATFTGLVRDSDGEQAVNALFLEHYPGMTERSLEGIVAQAQSRWPLLAVSVVHRIGLLRAGEQIVFVGVSSAHREAAFQACEFIMDYLKTRAPFWKKSMQADGDHWVEARSADARASARWQAAGAADEHLGTTD